MYRKIRQTDLSEFHSTSMGKIAKGVNKINFTMLYGNYCYIIIKNFPWKFAPFKIKISIWLIFKILYISFVEKRKSLGEELTIRMRLVIENILAHICTISSSCTFVSRTVCWEIIKGNSCISDDICIYIYIYILFIRTVVRIGIIYVTDAI